jgi:hypothetical protein
LGLTFSDLLIGFAARLLLFGASQGFATLCRAVGPGFTSLTERDRNRLASALDRAALARCTALEFVVFEFMHDAAD